MKKPACSTLTTGKCSKQLVLPFALLICLFFSLSAQAQALQWAKGMGGRGSDMGSSIVVDAKGNSYTVGQFINDTVDFDPGPGTYNLSSTFPCIYIAKYDANGQLKWARRIACTAAIWASLVAIDANGNVLTTGYFWGTADFDPGNGSAFLTSKRYNIFISKLDSAGNFVWANKINGSNSDYASALAVDTKGNVYTTGSFMDTADFDPGPGVRNLISPGNHDIFIAKYDQGGRLIWAKEIGDPLKDELAYDIAADAGGKIYITGAFSGTVDFDPGAGTYKLTSRGADDIFISRMDTSGSFIWARSLGGSTDDVGMSIAVSAKGNVYTTGYFSGTADFDPGNNTYNLTTGGDTDVFVSKLDVNGNFVWAKRLGGPGFETGISNALDADENIYTTGYFTRTADFDPGAGTYYLTSAGGEDIFISRLDSNGKYVWARRMGGTNEDVGASVAIDAKRNVLLTGYYGAPANFDSMSSANLSWYGSFDIFIAKYSQCNSTSTQTVSACRKYISPSGKFTWTATGTYRDTIRNKDGCDSVITFKLTINKANTSVTQSGHTLTSAATGNVAYQWLDCKQNYMKIAGATGSSFTPSANGSYAVVVNENGCIDTSACYNISGVGIEDHTFESRLTIYPNPTDGMFMIDLGEDLNSAEVSITNTLGQEVSRKQYYNASLLNLEISGKSGLYFIRISSGSKTATARVMKQ